MGSGKSTIAQLIAKQSNLVFYDSDSEIIKRSGVEIRDIFDREGEAGFRKRERVIIKELSQIDSVVLSTGGGCVSVAENREQLRKNGWVVHLRVSLETQLQRLRLSANKRPLFHDNPEKLAALNDERMPLYESIANVGYDTDNIAPVQLASLILETALAFVSLRCHKK